MWVCFYECWGWSEGGTESKERMQEREGNKEIIYHKGTAPGKNVCLLECQYSTKGQ